MPANQMQKSVIGIALAVPFMLFLNNPVFAEFYRWSDASGTVGFTDNLDRVPPQYRKSAERVVPETLAPSFAISPTGPSGTDHDTDIGNANTASEPPIDQTAALQNRVLRMKEDLELLREERQKAREQEIELLRQAWRQWGFADVELLSKALKTVHDLDQQIDNMESELSTTMPDEARLAGIPPSEKSVLSVGTLPQGQIDFTTFRLVSTGGMTRENILKLAGLPTERSYGGCVYCSPQWVYYRDDGWLFVVQFGSGAVAGPVFSYPSARMACDASPRPAGITPLCP